MKRALVLLAAWPGALLAEAAPSGVPVDSAAYAFKTLLALLLVVALVFVSAWALRRLQGLAPGGGGRLKVVAAVSVGSRERVVVVQVGDEQLLLGVAPGQVRTLHVLERPVEGEAPAATGFPARLRQALKGDGGHA